MTTTTFPEKNPVGTPLLKRIHDRIESYYPDIHPGEAQIREMPHSFIADNPLHLFEILDRKNNTQHVILAKHLLKEKSAIDAHTREFDMLNTLYGSSILRDGFAVPRPLDCFDDIRTVLMEKVEGIRLTDLVRRETKFFAADHISTIMTRCGQFLQQMHTATSSGEQVPLSVTMIDELFGKLDRTLAALKTGIPSTILDADRLRATVQECATRIRPMVFPMVRQHGDYYLGNIIVNGNDLFVFDFAFSKKGSIHHDIGRFLVTLETLNPYPQNMFFDLRKKRLFQKRFLQGYFGTLTDVNNRDWLLIHLHKLRSFLLHCQRRYIDSRHASLQRKIYFHILRRIYGVKVATEITTINSLLRSPELT